MMSDYVVQMTKGIKESMDNMSEVSISQYMGLPIFDMRNTDEYTEIFTSTESMTGSKYLSEMEAPPVLKLEDGYSVSFSENRFGGAILTSESDMRKMKDNTMKVAEFLSRQRDAVVRDNHHFFVTEAFKFLNEAFLSTSALLAPDAVEICGVHSWKTPGASTFDNGVTAALSTTALDAAMEFGGAFTDASGKPYPIKYDTIVVKQGSANERLARKLFAEGIAPTSIGDINIYQGEMTIVTTPYITTANKLYWFLFDSRFNSPLYVGVGQYPTMQEPIKQNNESVLANVTGFFKLGVTNMPFNVYGSTGAA